MRRTVATGFKSRAEQARIDATGHIDDDGEFDAEEDRLSDALSDAYWDLINTVPTTLAGVLAVIAFVRASHRTVNVFPECNGEADVEVFLQTLETAIDRHGPGMIRIAANLSAVELT